MSSVKVTILDPIYINLEGEPSAVSQSLTTLVVPENNQPMQVSDAGLAREIRVENGKLFYKSEGNWYQVTANQLGINE